MRIVCKLKLTSQFMMGACVAFACGCNAMNGGFNNNVGQNLYRQGNYTAARDEFQRAVANDPFNPDYLHNLAVAQKKQGNAAGAEQTYRKALQRSPDHQPSYHGLAQLMKEQNRSHEAVDLLQGWADTQPFNPEAHIEMAWLQREMGDVNGAERSLQAAHRAAPNDHVVMAQLGQLYHDTNQPDRAAAMYRRSLHAHWYQPEVQSRLSSLERSGVRPMPAGGAVYAAQPQYGPQFASNAYMQPTAAGYPLPTYSHALNQLPNQAVAQSTIAALPDTRIGPIMPTPAAAAPVSPPSSVPVFNPGPAPTPATNPVPTPVDIPEQAQISPLPSATPGSPVSADPAHANQEVPVVRPH